MEVIFGPMDRLYLAMVSLDGWVRRTERAVLNCLRDRPLRLRVLIIALKWELCEPVSKACRD